MFSRIPPQPFFAERVFQIFDKDNSGTVSLQEFLDAMHQFAGQSHDDKIRFLFKVYDLDGTLDASPRSGHRSAKGVLSTRVH